MDMFTRHPASVGESYGKHMVTAFGFGGRLLGLAVACFVHGLFPFLFERTASRQIGRLHEQMIVTRHRTATQACHADAVR